MSIDLGFHVLKIHFESHLAHNGKEIDLSNIRRVFLFVLNSLFQAAVVLSSKLIFHWLYISVYYPKEPKQKGDILTEVFEKLPVEILSTTIFVFLDH